MLAKIQLIWLKVLKLWTSSITFFYTILIKILQHNIAFGISYIMFIITMQTTRNAWVVVKCAETNAMLKQLFQYNKTKIVFLTLISWRSDIISKPSNNASFKQLTQRFVILHNGPRDLPNYKTRLSSCNGAAGHLPHYRTRCNKTNQIPLKLQTQI